MLKLIKYEFIKKYRMFLIVIATTLAANIYFAIKYGNKALGYLAGPMIFGLFVLYIIDVIKMYGNDVNKKTGYMLFMTPNSGYKIIASKVITALLEGSILLLFITVVSSVNLIFITGGVDWFSFDLYGLPMKEISSVIFMLLIVGVISSILFITIVYTSITIRKSLLNNSRFKGLLSMVIFLILNYVTMNIQGFVFENTDFNIYISTQSMSSFPTSAEMLTMLMPFCLVSTLLIVLLGFSSGYLLEKKINL